MPFSQSGSGSSGAAIVNNAVVRSDLSGNATTTSVSFVDCGKGLNGTITAVSGDVLLCAVQIMCQVSNIAMAPQFRLLATTGSHQMAYIAGFNAASTAQAAMPLLNAYTVVSGDISGGTVAFKLQFASDGSNTLTLLNSSSITAVINVLNMRQ